MKTYALFLDTQPHPMLHPSGPDVTWRQLIINLLGLTDEDIFYENLKMKLADRVGNGEYIEKLGLLDKTPIHKQGTPIDTLSHYLSKRLVSLHSRALLINYTRKPFTLSGLRCQRTRHHHFAPRDWNQVG